MASISIQSYVQELKEVNTEIKRLQDTIKLMKQRSADLEKQVISYLNEKEQPGVKYKNTAIIIENKPKRLGKTKKDIESESIRILQESGIANPREVLERITKSRKGDQVQIQKVKLKNI